MTFSQWRLALYRLFIHPGRTIITFDPNSEPGAYLRLPTPTTAEINGVTYDVLDQTSQELFVVPYRGEGRRLPSTGTEGTVRIPWNDVRTLHVV